MLAVCACVRCVRACVHMCVNARLRCGAVRCGAVGAYERTKAASVGPAQHMTASMLPMPNTAHACTRVHTCTRAHTSACDARPCTHRACEQAGGAAGARGGDDAGRAPQFRTPACTCVHTHARVCTLRMHMHECTRVCALACCACVRMPVLACETWFEGMGTSNYVDTHICIYRHCKTWLEGRDAIYMARRHRKPLGLANGADLMHPHRCAAAVAAVAAAAAAEHVHAQRMRTQCTLTTQRYRAL